MKTPRIGTFSRRLVLFSALLVVGSTQGCSCDSDDTVLEDDVALDGAFVQDASDVSDAVADAHPSSDAGLDASGDAGSDTASAADATPGDVDAGTEVDAGLDADTERDTDTSGDAHAGLDADTGGDAGTGDDAGTDGGLSSGDCISGATGTHAVRFQWQGNGPNSTAYVDYEVNELPDTSRWHVGAYSSSFSYSPVYTDTFLGEGGLELSGTVFIDVELSTAGLGALDQVTIALYGRSFNTTSSGSFTWQTFSGTGATPSGHVANSAPYQWYLADATAALPAGDASTLLRLRAGPSSNSLVVNSVEICFDEL